MWYLSTLTTPQDDLPPTARSSAGDTVMPPCSTLRADMRPRHPHKSTKVSIPSISHPLTPQLWLQLWFGPVFFCREDSTPSGLSTCYIALALTIVLTLPRLSTCLPGGYLPPHTRPTLFWMREFPGAFSLQQEHYQLKHVLGRAYNVIQTCFNLGKLSTTPPRVNWKGLSQGPSWRRLDYVNQFFLTELIRQAWSYHEGAEEEKAALKYICMLHLAGLDLRRGCWIFKACFSSVLQGRKCSSFIA